MAMAGRGPARLLVRDSAPTPLKKLRPRKRNVRRRRLLPKVVARTHAAPLPLDC
jgi:hypothetical protein